MLRLPYRILLVDKTNRLVYYSVMNITKRQRTLRKIAEDLKVTNLMPSLAAITDNAETDVLMINHIMEEPFNLNLGDIEAEYYAEQEIKSNASRGIIK